MKGIGMLKRLGAALRREDYEASYAQCGEDRILRFLFNCLQLAQPAYLDIGAHHPTYLSNTFLFYKEGSRGVCVEPDPQLCQHIRARRAGDVCLNVGVAAAGGGGKLKFHVFDDPAMNTFSETIKAEQVRAGRILKQELQVEVLSINAIIARHFSPWPNLVSLDTEGMDLAILETFDFAKYQPEAFCIETLTNVDDRKMTEIIEFMTAHGYVVYADTYVNTIFVEKGRWETYLAGRRNRGTNPQAGAVPV